MKDKLKELREENEKLNMLINQKQKWASDMVKQVEGEVGDLSIQVFKNEGKIELLEELEKENNPTPK